MGKNEDSTVLALGGGLGILSLLVLPGKLWDFPVCYFDSQLDVFFPVLDTKTATRKIDILELENCVLSLSLWLLLQMISAHKERPFEASKDSHAKKQQ